MKKILSLLTAFGVMFYLTSCNEDEDPQIDENTENVVLSGLIEEDLTLTADKIYELSGRVIVTGGATLTIQPGTIIKGRTGEGTNASVLMIARDGYIEAVGTADKPIIFTSVEDNIEVGQIKGSNLEVGDNQLWGGVVILGSAPISPKSGATAQIEGVPASEPLGQYGGDDPTDDQGTLKYISIRHGGTTIDPSEGNDINGLTLGGVGSGTEISFIEILANYDDGIEFFGGTVNVSNALVYTVGDDAIDVDQAWSGILDNFMVYTSTAGDSDEALEIDGPEGSENNTGKFTLKNGTIVSVDGGGSAADFKSRAQGTIENVKYSGFSGGAVLKVSTSLTADCQEETDAYTNLASGNLIFSTVEFDQIEVYDAAESGCDISTMQNNAETKVATETATGASNTAAWDGWTIAASL